MSIIMSPLVVIQEHYINSYEIVFRLHDVVAKKIRSVTHPEIQRYPFYHIVHDKVPCAGLLIAENLVPERNDKKDWEELNCYAVTVNYDNYGGSGKENSNSETFRFFSKVNAEKAHQDLRKAIAMVS